MKRKTTASTVLGAENKHTSRRRDNASGTEPRCPPSFQCSYIRTYFGGVDRRWKYKSISSFVRTYVRRRRLLLSTYAYVRTYVYKPQTMSHRMMRARAEWRGVLALLAMARRRERPECPPPEAVRSYFHRPGLCGAGRALGQPVWVSGALGLKPRRLHTLYVRSCCLSFRSCRRSGCCRCSLYRT